MKIRGTIQVPFYDHGGRKYIEVLSDKTQFRIKIPFRYGRVMAEIDGIVPIQDLNSGQTVEVQVEKRHGEHLVLLSLKTIEC